MKIKTEHFEHMKKEIQKTIERIDKEAGKNVYSEYQKLGLSNKRYNWDVLRNAGLLSFVCDTLYKYMNDDHIDTALKAITGKR